MIQKLKTPILIVAVIALIIALFSFFYSNDSQPETESLKIGIIAPLSGDYAAIGENFVKGMRVAESVYEKQTGVDIELIVEDDGADAVKGLSAFNKLIQIDKVNGLINTFTSTMDAIYEQSIDLPYPVIMGAFQANNVADDHVFQITPGNDNTWNRYANYINNLDINHEKMIIVHSQAAAQESFAKEFAKNYTTPIELFVASSDKGSLRTDAAKVVGMNPTSILIMMTPENGAIFTKELLPLVSDDVNLFYDIQIQTGAQLYLDNLGSFEAINGAYALNLEGESNQAFTDTYTEVIGEKPGFLSDYGYDALMTYLLAYDSDENVWIKNLKDTKLDGASGKVSFDAQGIIYPSLTIKQVVNGEMVVRERLK